MWWHLATFNRWSVQAVFGCVNATLNWTYPPSFLPTTNAAFALNGVAWRAAAGMVRSLRDAVGDSLDPSTGR